MGQNLSTSEKIKFWAKVFRVIGFVWIGLAELAGIIIWAIDTWFWWIALLTMVFGPFLSWSIFFMSTMILGFGEIVENTKGLKRGAAESDSYTDLPKFESAGKAKVFRSGRGSSSIYTDLPEL